MSSPVAEENEYVEYVTRDRLKKQYPRLPEDIIDRAIETFSWHTLFGGTNRYNSQFALDHYYIMALCIVEKRCTNSIASIELFLLDKNRCSEERVKPDDSELVKGIRSLPEGVERLGGRVVGGRHSEKINDD